MATDYSTSVFVKSLADFLLLLFVNDGDCALERSIDRSMV